MRLIFITAITAFFLAFAYFGVRVWGLSMPYQKFDHEFLKTQPLEAVRVKTIDEVQSLIREEPRIILWLDIHQTRDAQLVVVPTESLEQTLTAPSLGERWRGSAILPRYDLAEIRPLLPKAPLLKDVLAATTGQRLVLNITDNADGIDLAVAAAVKDLSPEKRVLIQSDIDVILRSIKAEHPMWLYGTSWADITKLLSFDSIGLAPAIEFKGDVFLAPVEIAGRPAYNTSLIAEMRRRLKSIFIGPLHSREELETAREVKPDGVIFNDPSLWRELH